MLLVSCFPLFFRLDLGSQMFVDVPFVLQDLMWKCSKTRDLQILGKGTGSTQRIITENGN